eukprot:2513228-Rhodomonas_salina.2
MAGSQVSFPTCIRSCHEMPGTGICTYCEMPSTNVRTCCEILGADLLYGVPPEGVRYLWRSGRQVTGAGLPSFRLERGLILVGMVLFWAEMALFLVAAMLSVPTKAQLLLASMLTRVRGAEWMEVAWTGEREEEVTVEVLLYCRCIADRYVIPNPRLNEALGVDLETESGWIKALWAYIKKKKLMDPNDMTHINLVRREGGREGVCGQQQWGFRGLWARGARRNGRAGLSHAQVRERGRGSEKKVARDPLGGFDRGRDRDRTESVRGNGGSEGLCSGGPNCTGACCEKPATARCLAQKIRSRET